MGRSCAARGTADGVAEPSRRGAASARDIIRTVKRGAGTATIARWLTEVRARHGRGFAGQIWDILRFRLSLQRVDPLEYYEFKLYERARREDAKRRPYVGMKSRGLLATRINSPLWSAIGDDKLMSYAVLDGLGHAVPGLYALHHAWRTYGRQPALRDRQAVEGFLRNGMTYPFFGKPVDASSGMGVAAVLGYERDGDSLVFPGDRRMTVPDFATVAGGYARRGYMFLELLRPHPAIVALCGDRLCTLRLVVLREGGDVTVQAAVWKVAAGSNMADNNQYGGNALAPVDVATGLVGRVVTGNGPDEVELAVHPDTGKPFAGFVLPDFAEAKRLCVEATLALPGLPWLGWDIALTPAGPVVVELNTAGGLTLAQHAVGHGLMTERYARLLRARRSRFGFR